MSKNVRSHYIHPRFLGITPCDGRAGGTQLTDIDEVLDDAGRGEEEGGDEGECGVGVEFEGVESDVEEFSSDATVSEEQVNLWGVSE